MSELYSRICEEGRRKEAREQWVAMLPWMAAKILKFKPFQEYFDQVSGANFDLRPDEEILAEVAEIRKEMKGE